MEEVPELIVCEGCDAVYPRADLRPHEFATCRRCGTVLARYWGRMHERMLPLTVACLILFAIANFFPIVSIELRGLHSETTLLGAVLTLAAEGMSEVGLLVLLTTLLFPLVQLCVLLYLLVPINLRNQPPVGFRILVRAMQVMRPWGMIEVFLLGVLVAVVKLSGMAQVIPGAALWAFVGLTVLLTAVLAFEPQAFWRLTFGHKGETRP